jgi:endo-1,4-beta-xylanase
VVFLPRHRETGKQERWERGIRTPLLGPASRSKLGGLAAIAAVLLALAAPAAARTGPVQLGAAVGGPAFIEDPDPRYKETLQLFDALTPENDLKMLYVRPSRGTFELTRADAMVAFAAAHGQMVHGHTLVWCNDAANPDWLANGSWTRAELLDVLDEHITTVMSHYRGRVSSWDVVNEALNDDGTRRDCIWQRVIGDDWVEQAFRIARRADPAPRLFYNEVRADTANAKYEAMLALARDFLARGVPLDGIGLQYHIGMQVPTQAAVEEAIRRIGEVGLAVHISELDVPVYYLGSTLEQKLARQTEIYRAIAAACQAQQACFRITTWGFTDRYTWRCCNAKPLPFDEEYRPKAAWFAIQEALSGAGPPPPPPPVPPVASPQPVPRAADSAPRVLARLSVFARIRREDLGDWLRRSALVVRLRVEGPGPLTVRVVIRLHGRVLAQTIFTIARGDQRTIDLRLSKSARKQLRRAVGSRIVALAFAKAADGRTADARSRVLVHR